MAQASRPAVKRASRKSRSTEPPSTSPDDPVTDYALRVTRGDIVAGPHVRDACARHLKDLVEGSARGIYWDLEAAQRFIGFCADVCCLNGGKFEGKPFILEPVQAFLGGSIFGWKREDGRRRFRVAFIEKGKGNGKSPFAAAVGLYCLTADGEPRAEIYAAATKKDQAQVLFRDAVAMVDLSPELDRRLVRSGSKGKEWNLAYLSNGSFFRPVSSDKGQSGPRPHCALLDEIHEHKTGAIVELMRAGTKGREQALIVMITNSGSNKTSTCGEYHDYAVAVCAGMVEDDSFFGYVCALDEDDDPFKDEGCWIKANPLLGISIQPDYIREQVREARGIPSKESTVKRLNFCQWVGADAPWLSPADWLAAVDAHFDDDQLAGRRCWGGLDLSSTTDLTAFVLLFEPTEADPVWRQKSWFWLPAQDLDEKERKDKVPYSAWRAAGWLEATPGRAVDKAFVLARVVDAAARYDIQAIGFDEWRKADLEKLMENDGVTLPLVGFRQGFKSMAPAVDEYELRLIRGLLRHDGNPVMTWCAANAVVEEDPAGNRKLTKARSTGRIDGAVSGVMAAGVSMLPQEDDHEFQMFSLN